MRITKNIKIDASADKVWKVFAHDFDRASEWMSSVPTTYGQDLGQRFDGAKSAGRVCELNGDPKGIKAKEYFLAYDEEARTCTIDIEIDGPALLPIRGNVLDFSIEEDGPNRSIVHWDVTVKVKPLANLVYPLVKLGLSVLFGQVPEELKYFVENDAPHPRKLKATRKATAAQHA